MFVTIHTVLALHYPRPVSCIHDKEGGLIGSAFQWLLELITIKDLCLKRKNPQSNAICERMHQTVSNVLRTLVHTNPPQNMAYARDIVDDHWPWQCTLCKQLLLLPSEVLQVLLPLPETCS